MSSEAGLGSRRTAMRLLDEVLRRRTPLDDAILALRRKDQAGTPLSDADWALTRAIATTALRRLPTLRAVIGSRLRLGVPDRSGRLETVLTVAVAQLLFLDVPDHAVVDTAITLIREDRHAARYAGLANALLRRVARERDAILAEDVADAPEWLAERWARAYGLTNAGLMIAANRRQPTLDITVKENSAVWAEQLGGVALFGQTVRVLAQTPVAALSGYESGAWWVQDAAASLPVMLLDPKRGERVLDLCAAPGGKTAQIAAAGASVVAVDRAAPRVERLRTNLARLKLEAEIHTVEALAFAPEERFDAVLLDAPCTATGTIRRHPDVAWTKTEADVAKLSAAQAKLLAHAASLVKPGGRLVYATCSLEPEEGEDQVARFLAATPGFSLEPAARYLPEPLLDAVTSDGALRTLPCMLPDPDPRRAGMDGFFAARLRRNG